VETFGVLRRPFHPGHDHGRQSEGQVGIPSVWRFQASKCPDIVNALQPERLIPVSWDTQEVPFCAAKGFRWPRITERTFCIAFPLTTVSALAAGSDHHTSLVPGSSSEEDQHDDETTNCSDLLRLRRHPRPSPRSIVTKALYRWRVLEGILLSYGTDHPPPPAPL
jgi:hypothetical protein